MLEGPRLSRGASPMLNSANLQLNLLQDEVSRVFGRRNGQSRVETAVGGRKTTAEQGRYCHTHGHTTSKRLPKVKSTHNWKPKLNAISEDSPLSEVNRGGVNRRIGGSGDKKRQVKVKPKSPARLRRHQFTKRITGNLRTRWLSLRSLRHRFCSEY
ncbi:hypothetical protein DH2020_025103 [Rehmannia glutinosa]|uniref:Uncharacterized protein n=1 Tax=Rehmannia glutinosa TaxID=99300 RepID=A0ABR0W336_REHGL